MSSAVGTLGISLTDTLRELSRRPWVLASLLLVINSFFFPYLGIIHDAQIYSGLILNRLDPELMSGDLFFQYGSQDKYSAFSPLMAPLAQLLGIKTAFFLGYLFCVAFFLAALTRFVTRLWPDSPGAVIGLIYLAIVPVAYGGFVPLHVLEPFLTARIPACAFTLWALAEWIDNRRMSAIIFLIAAAAVHPLMALPGVMVVGIVAIQDRFGTRGNILFMSAGFAAVLGILAYPPLAARLFGYVDPEWYRITRETNSYQFPLEWTADQWFRNLYSIAGLGLAAWLSRGASSLAVPQQSDCVSLMRSQVLAASAIVGLAGFFGSLAFTELPYSLLLKGQAYRWLWLPLALTAPCLFDLAWNAWQTGEWKRRLGAISIVVATGVVNFIPLEFVTLLFFVPVFYYGFRTFAKSMPIRDALAWTILSSSLVGFAIWAVYRLWIYLEMCSAVREHSNVILEYHIGCVTLSAAVIVPLLLLAAAGLNRRLFSMRSVRVSVALALLFQVALYAWSMSNNFKANQPQAEELRFVENFLNARRAQGNKPLCVYSDYGKLGQTWVEWRTRSFYDCFQLAGFVFNRDTAIEGKRRVAAVAPFEAASLMKRGWDSFPDICKNEIENWLNVSVEDCEAPGPEDLYRLAREESIDYIVLFKSHIDHLAVARHGDVSIYDCRALRETRLACCK